MDIILLFKSEIWLAEDIVPAREFRFFKASSNVDNFSGMSNLKDNKAHGWIAHGTQINVISISWTFGYTKLSICLKLIQTVCDNRGKYKRLFSF